MTSVRDGVPLRLRRTDRDSPRNLKEDDDAAFVAKSERVEPVGELS